MSRFMAAALAACLALPAAAQEQPGTGTVIATVNGEDITLGHLLLLRGELPPAYLEVDDGPLYEALLAQLIGQTALSHLFEETERSEAGEDNAVRNYRSDVVLNRVIGERVTDEAVRAAFDAQVEEMGDVLEWNASHILVETEAEALDLKNELDGGADFAELAMERSTGPTGPRGGELGWFRGGMMVPTFQAAVETLDEGETSAPVETRFGWHVIKLNETRTVPPLIFEEFEERLRESLTDEAVSVAVAKAIEDADVSLVEGIDPSVISDEDLLSEWE